MKALLYFAAVALLAGCATPAERAAQKQREMDETMQVYGPACEKLGYKNGSDPWRDCVLRLSSQESFERYQAAYPAWGWNSCWNRGFFQCPMF